MPDVWYAYSGFEVEALADDPLLGPEPGVPEPPVLDTPPSPGTVLDRRVDLLMRPHEEASASELAVAIERRLQGAAENAALAYNDVYVAAKLTFKELLRDALPLSRWWQQYLWRGAAQPFAQLVQRRRDEIAHEMVDPSLSPQGLRPTAEDELPGDLVWFVGLVGRLAWEAWPESGEASPEPGEPSLPTASNLIDAAVEIIGPVPLGQQPEGIPLWSVTRNRPVRSAVWLSRQAVKADAAERLFGLSCRDICWAVIDSGIDARHPAFAVRDDDAPVNQSVDAPDPSSTSRVRATYDFSNIRQRLTAQAEPMTATIDDPETTDADRTESWVRHGRAVDWDSVVAQLAIPHDQQYVPPADEHGTHVAGILGGDWRTADEPSPGEHDVKGICPDIALFDLRVFGADGTSDEFSILSAMQFVRHLNAHSERLVIHGVNLSFAVRHEVAKYAAGRTPVCEEANRLVGAGIVVVAAAGNDGRASYMVGQRAVEGYRTVSIADPGNADEVITVGATHRNRPHEYGVSYFSSRGPTGDGRQKPDLVAPGEKITAPVPNGGLKTLDGTSQAAPHVSGVAALLLARYSELIGQPTRVKEILCTTCTDLGRVHEFQGAGLVDSLRALQAV